LPDKGANILLDLLILNNKIDFKFRILKQNKNPDMVILLNKEIYIIEHKLSNGNGGAQNSEINEIIEFIGQQESNPHVHYISCLEGDFQKNIHKDSTNKHKAQYNNIMKNLLKFPSNYFVNGHVFSLLIQDLLEMKL
jgi:hypothetical protein